MPLSGRLGRPDTRCSPSARLERILQGSSGDRPPVSVLNSLLHTLRENDVPGPQLFRLEKEFSVWLGEGGQGNVRGIDGECAKTYQHTSEEVRELWPVELIAIKQYQWRDITEGDRDITEGDSEQKARLKKDKARFNKDVTSRLEEVESEVLALSPSLFRGNPNIVQLVGWGFCLDTIERNMREPCGSTQIPLLLLERAEMDLLTFLRNRLFPKKTCGPEADAEEGRASPDDPTKARPTASSSGWYTLIQWAAAEDPYELIRLLCLDIGHGLQSLHDNKFTHGDLKPENVLIFKTPRRYSAKLCDFGCARGEDDENVGTNGTSSGGRPPKRKYRGTVGWQPPPGELSADSDFNGLRKCDVYVYGLVVWSCFYYEGEIPENLTRPKTQNDNPLKKIRLENIFDTWNRESLSRRIHQVLQDTMASQEVRSLTPWEHLYGWFQRRPRYRKPAMDPKTLSDARRVCGTRNVHPPLSSDMKTDYNTMEWWPHQSVSDPPQLVASTMTTTESPTYNDTISHSSPTIPQTSPDNSTAEIFGPASSQPLGPDDNFLSNKTFLNGKRRQDVSKLVKDMNNTLSSWPGLSSSVELYCYARFRSRIPLKWWLEAETEIPMLEKALSLTPAVDISALAWLCYGPVGRLEVKKLSADYETWRPVISPKKLNESERLDRFLLLLQSGAEIWKRIMDDHGVSGSILFWFVFSSRPATVSTVVREIFSRFSKVRDMEHISPKTKYYMTGNSSRAVGGFTARTDINSATFGSLSKISDSGGETNEGSPLLQLPRGWERHTNYHDPTKPYFTELITDSVTLDEPKFSPMEAGQIEVGLLSGGEEDKCSLYLTDYMRSGTSGRAKRVFNKQILERFPDYNDDWYAKEWLRDASHDDVLKDLKDMKAPKKIAPFADRLPKFEIWKFLTETTLRMFDILGRVLLSIGGLTLILLVSALALALALALLWLLLPLLALFVVFFVPVGIAFVASRGSPGFMAIIIIPVLMGVGVYLYNLLLDTTCHKKDPSSDCLYCAWALLSYFSCSIIPLRPRSCKVYKC